MIERIIELSIRNRLFVVILALVGVVFGIYTTLDTPVDAIPDLGENQVIVFTDWPGRSPREIEDQITYPLSLKLQGLAGVKSVRSSSEFNFSMITIIFEDNVDIYFARVRVLERLQFAASSLPTGVVPYISPDASALGQIFWYTVEPSARTPIDPQRLWALNKFYISPMLNSVAGVAEVAVVGGTPMEYQIDIQPEILRAYGLSLGEIYSALSKSNLPAGGGIIQMNNAEYIVRGVGWIQNIKEIENTMIREVKGVPIYVKTVATVQLGMQYRRSVFEKNGNEMVGGVALMRYGENPLRVTKAIKKKIEEIQVGLPTGVQIVPAYDRTRLIEGAIHTLSNVMLHEMIIAAIAILLILAHFRSALIICITLPFSVLFSFSIMWFLRKWGILDVQANIMSLAGITISIGILVDQAIVMVENATHHLKDHFGDKKVRGDTRELVIPACRLVGRPIFFSVLIMLVSFLPVFMFSGREGKLFHPLAFTKSFALVGVSILSITLVPALIPILIRGRLKSEEQNRIVRSFIHIYKPILHWALGRWNLVMWMFAVLLIVAASIFPIQALFGLGASEYYWEILFLLLFSLVTAITVIFSRGLIPQILSLGTLLFIGIISYHLHKHANHFKIGVTFMPMLDEQTILDMPITVPRASITQSADDLKARNSLLRGFPEVESVIGKAGRADTATDPSPIEMVETFVNFRPHEFWPRRVLRFQDAQQQTITILKALQNKGYLPENISLSQLQNLTNSSAQTAIERMDEVLRELALQRFNEIESSLRSILLRLVMDSVLSLQKIPQNQHEKTAELVKKFLTTYLEDQGTSLAIHPERENIVFLQNQLIQQLIEQHIVSKESLVLKPARNNWETFKANAKNLFGITAPDLVQITFQNVLASREEFWQREIVKINRELLNIGTFAFTCFAIEELFANTDNEKIEIPEQKKSIIQAFMQNRLQERLHEPHSKSVPKNNQNPLLNLHNQSSDTSENPFNELNRITKELADDFHSWVFLWKRQGGTRGDLVEDEMLRVLHVTGWSDIFTQPIINRIEMLSTGIRTPIGVKVFGPDLETINRVSSQVEQALKAINGSKNVVANPIMGKGYLEIKVDRLQAARYGISVEDIENEIEMAFGGRVITYTIEKRDRFPVRLRYSRSFREDEESIRKLLIPTNSSSKIDSTFGSPENNSAMESHQESANHMVKGKTKLIPLSAVAHIGIVEGPGQIKSEGGQLVNYVFLDVNAGRDVVGFVEEAKQSLEQTLLLPEGVHLEWTGEFEHQERAAKTLRWVFPAVLLLIFMILYLTYQDLADAVLMMLAVPEALAGGAFALFLLPKLISGWDTNPLDFSVAVWVGFIACFGMATETGIIMLVYLRHAIEKRGGLENIQSLEELKSAVIEGAVHRLRPKLLTEGVAILSIFPMVFATGVGAEVLAPMALPVLGGLMISDEVVDIFLPVRFYWLRRNRWLKLQAKRQKRELKANQENRIVNAN